MYSSPIKARAPLEIAIITGDFFSSAASKTAFIMSMLSTLKAPIAYFPSYAFLNISFVVTKLIFIPPLCDLRY